MKQSENINEVSEAISALQGEVVDADKDVQGYNYKYANLSSCLDIARPLLNKHGLALTQHPQCKGQVMTLTSLLSHKSGQWMKSSLDMEVSVAKNLSQAQCVGIAITYARRYALTAILGITQQDSDGSTKEVQAAPKKRVNREVVQGSMVALLASVEDGDGLGAKQIMGELRDTPEQDATWQLFTTRQKNAIKALVNGVEG